MIEDSKSYENQAAEQCRTACGSVAGGYYADKVQTISATVEVRADKSFDVALSALRNGQRITRAGWNGRGQSVQLQTPDKHSLMTRPYAVIRSYHGDLTPWTPSQGDLFATDWAVLPT